MGGVFNSYPCDLVLLHWFLSGNIFLVWDFLPVEGVTSGVTATSGLTSSGYHLTRLAPDLGRARQKYVCTVPFWAAYDTPPSSSLMCKKWFLDIFWWAGLITNCNFYGIVIGSIEKPDWVSITNLILGCHLWCLMVTYVKLRGIQFLF